MTVDCQAENIVYVVCVTLSSCIEFLRKTLSNVVMLSWYVYRCSKKTISQIHMSMDRVFHHLQYTNNDTSCIHVNEQRKRRHTNDNS